MFASEVLLHIFITSLTLTMTGGTTGFELVIHLVKTCESSRIVSRPDVRFNGSALLEEFPWIARLKYRKRGYKNIKKFLCGGSLISERYVLTAAHCFAKMDWDLDSVRLGEFDEKTDPDCNLSKCADPVVDYAPEKVIIHEDYGTPRLSSNDIALVRLSGTVKFSKSVSPICLPLVRKNSYIDYVTRVAGWPVSTGKREFYKPITELHITYSEVLDDYSECRREYGEWVTENKYICVSSSPLRFCEGDSGGPLMGPEIWEGDSSPRYVIEGVMTTDVQTCEEQKTTSLYANVTSHLIWILENIEEKTIHSTVHKNHLPISKQPVYPKSSLPSHWRNLYARESTLN